MMTWYQKAARFLSLPTLIIIAISGATAQSRTANTTIGSDAYLVQGIAIYKTGDMKFGAIVPGTSGGNITLSTAGGRTGSGTVTLPSTLPVSAAVFVVLGPPNQTYSLSIPSSTTLGRQGGSDTMSVTNFVSSPSLGGTFNSGGSSTVLVGATLAVGGNQTFGQYAGSFTVTVSYP